MGVSLTQKERSLLQDQQKHEQLCVDKYSAYANQAKDAQLKQLFTDYAGQEQTHLNTINQMLSGQVPSMNQQGQQQQNAKPAPQQAAMSVMGNQADAALCDDMLMTEKYVSGTYDTAIFEFKNADMRNTLNHIQKEEQQHGEGLFNYMQSHGMYNAQ